jgi:hypothetical protein
MFIVSHPTGNANVRQALRALEDDGLLLEYVTFFATIKGNIFDFLARLPGGGEFERRRLQVGYANKCVQRPWPELLRLLGQRFGLRSLVDHQTGLFCPDRNNQRLGKFAAERLQRGSGAPAAVYCYEDAALEVFREARKRRVATIYDLPTGYWRAKQTLFEEEAQLQPVWSQLLPAREDGEAKLRRKDEELSLADLVITASTLTDTTLRLYPGRIPAVKRIAYGAPTCCERQSCRPADSALRCLFVGSLSQQKGLSYMFEALESVQVPVDMTVVGRSSRRDFEPLNRALARVNYFASLPHQEILQLMRSNDILLFPTLFDGFGLVMLEAMSQGCVVVATPNCGAPDVIRDGHDGFIVPIRDPRAIAEKLELLHRDRGRLAAMSEAARKKAESLTWESYRKGVVEAVRSVLGEAKGK